MNNQNQFTAEWLATHHHEESKKLWAEKNRNGALGDTTYQTLATTSSDTGNAVVGKKKSYKEASAFIFIVDPIGKPRMTQQDKWKKRPAVMRYRAYADEMRRQAAKIGFEMNQNVLNAEFYLPMPDSWSKIKKDLMRETSHTSKPDLDNLEKSIGDIFLKNDSTIHTNNTKKIWSDIGKIIIW